MVDKDRTSGTKSDNFPDFDKMEDAPESDMWSALEEVRILSSIRHPHIVKYKEAFFDAEIEQLCLVMEYVNHSTLSKLIAKKVNENKEW